MLDDCSILHHLRSIVYRPSSERRRVSPTALLIHGLMGHLLLGCGGGRVPTPRGYPASPPHRHLWLTRVGKEGRSPSQCLVWWSCWRQGRQHDHQTICSGGGQSPPPSPTPQVITTLRGPHPPEKNIR